MLLCFYYFKDEQRFFYGAPFFIRGLRFVLAPVWVFSYYFSRSQVNNPESVKSMINRYKEDPRGPYQDIRWFCNDGSMRAARDPCPDQPGSQRAHYKEEVELLAANEHIFLGQILATTPYVDFWDEDMAQSRMIHLFIFSIPAY